MPSRWLCALIIGCWALLTAELLRRDVLPGLLVGPPPDLRTILRNPARDDQPVRWAILVSNPRDPLDVRSVGQARTSIRRSNDGWMNLTSSAWFDSGELLKGTPLGTESRERISVQSLFSIEPAGNLDRMRIGVRLGNTVDEIVIVEGKVQGNDLVLRAHSDLPLLKFERRFPYQSHSLVQNALGPVDYLPGLRVGQRWSHRMVSPMTGAVDDVTMAVEKTSIITWDQNPVTTLEVVTRSGPIQARTWVHPDGRVLRQELPVPFLNLILERLPEGDDVVPLSPGGRP
jgi:hypothetical protein